MVNNTVRKRAHKGVAAVMNTSQKSAQNIQKRKNRAVEQLYKRASQGRDNINTYIQKNPKKSVLMAAGAGAVASSVVSATMSKKKRAET